MTGKITFILGTLLLSDAWSLVGEHALSQYRNMLTGVPKIRSAITE